MSFRRGTFVHVVLIVILGLLVYSNTIDSPFTFDDFPNVQENYLIRNLSNIPLMFEGGTGPFASRPLMHATNALNYRFGGLDPRGYHAVNITLHLINGMLLYFLIVMTGRLLKYGEEGTRPVALLASLLFVAHPVQTEAVTYVVSRSMLLATTFYLLGILLFVKAVTLEKRKGLYIAGLFFTSLLGAASRENFITFPVILILYDLCFISHFRAKEALRRWRLYLPALTGCVYSVYLVISNSYNIRQQYTEISIPPLQYVLSQLNVQWTYLRLLVLPINQNLDYAYPFAQTLLELPTAVSFVGYIGLWAGGIYLARRKFVLSFAILWFVITLAPVSIGLALTDLRLGDVIFEHRLYLPSAGLIAGLLAGAVSAAGQMKTARARKAVVVFLLIVLVMFSTAAYKRNEVWRNGISLWSDAVKKSPENERAYINLAGYYSVAGRLDEAIHFYHIALSSDSTKVPSAFYAVVYTNLANNYFEKGLLDKAVMYYETGIALDQKRPSAYIGLGNVYMGKGLLDKAIDYYRTSVRLDPRSLRGYNSLGNAYLRKGLLEEAIESYEKVIAIDPRYATAYNNLGIAYSSLGRYGEAIKNFEAALELWPDNADVHRNISTAYSEMGLSDMAEQHLRMARELSMGE